MNKDLLNKAIPYIAIIVIFLSITLVYFSPLIAGKKLNMHDIKMYKGMSKEITDFREDTGEEPLWTNSMFGGMPAWQISVRYTGNLMRYVDDALMLWLPQPAGYVFLYFVGFFILMLVLRINPWIGLAGSIAFAMSSYFFIILGAGHTSKAHAIGYMAPVLAGIILAYRGKYWQGALLMAVALALEIKSGHLQITYYLLIIVVLYGIYQLIESIVENKMPQFAKATGFLVAAALLAVLTHSTNLWATYEYGQDTMRGKPELTNDQADKSSGLDRTYITAWSYGIGETWSLMIPKVKGGASGQISDDKALDKASQNYRSTIAQQNSYWGDQPGTSGPVYVGIIVVFLFFLGLIIVDDNLKWVLLTATVLSILLAWGKNFMWFTDIFIDFVPGYNKFRAVSMILVIAELAMPILAFMAVQKLISTPGISKYNLAAFFISIGLTGGLLLIFLVAPTVFFSFVSAAEDAQFRQYLTTGDAAQVVAFIENLEAVRIAIFKTDILVRMFFLAAAAALVFAFILRKIPGVVLILGLALLILVDMTIVDRKYVNNDNFVRARVMDQPFQPSQANQQILADNDPNFRVLDLTKSTFNDASCSYFHKSIGGYHGAKLQRYQDLINAYINPEIMDMVDRLPGQKPQTQLNYILSQQKVLNMLNMKYIILRPDMSPLPNPNSFGSVWLVNDYQFVENPDEEIAALSSTDLRKTAIVDVRFRDQLEGKSFSRNPMAEVALTSYEPNHLQYALSSATEQLVVFSEVYYDKGWKAFINGEEAPYFRTNYILRGMVVPAGDSVIEFKFEPRVWVVGEKISFASSLLLILMVLAALAVQVKKLVAAPQNKLEENTKQG